jgi:hypothetical protein
VALLHHDTKPKHAPTVPVVNRKQMAPLTAYASHPSGIHFETQEQEETVELFLRQHPIVNLPWVMVSFLLLLIPNVILPPLLVSFNLTSIIPGGYVLVGTVFWYVATLGFILTNFISWFFNIYIVTNERIVDIDFYFLLYKHFSQAELTRIQDLSFTSSGILPTVFNYGNVIVQTASETPSLEFDKVPYPEKVVETIRMLLEKNESV